MICKQCGAEMPNRAKFCTECGADLSDRLNERRGSTDDVAADEAEPAPDIYPSDGADAGRSRPLPEQQAEPPPADGAVAVRCCPPAGCADAPASRPLPLTGRVFFDPAGFSRFPASQIKEPLIQSQEWSALRSGVAPQRISNIFGIKMVGFIAKPTIFFVSLRGAQRRGNL